jgi:hypothetical protein
MKTRFNTKTFNIILAFLMFTIALSCKKDRAKPSWDVDLLIPLLQDSITLYDVLDDQFFQENPDQSISMVFEEELYKMNLDTLVALPDTLLTFGLGLDFLPGPITLQPGDTVISQKFILPLELDGQDVQGVILEKVILRSGDIVFEAYNQSETDLLVSLGMVNVFHPETGSFYAEEIVANNNLFQQGFNIQDYELDLTGPNHDTVNLMTYDVALIISPDEPGPVSIYPQDSVALNVYFKDVVVNYARGYFGKNSYTEGPEIYPIDFLEEVEVENISFDNAEIYFIIENTYGLEVNFRMQELAAISTKTQDTVILESTLIDSDLFVDRAHEVVEESGNIETQTESFDFSDSNFPDLFAIKPDQMSYVINAEVNVRGDSTNYDNFFYYDHPVIINMNARVNGGIKFDSLFQSDRLEWDASSLSLAEVKEGSLKMTFSNAFPFDFNMSLYLENQDTVVIDTLIFKETIAAGYIGIDGFVESAKKTMVEIPLDDHLREEFKNGRFASYEIYVNSAEGNGVSIHANNHLSFQVIGDFIYLFEQD